MNTPNIEVRVADALRDIGIPSNLKGYRCLTEALLITVEDPEMLKGLTKRWGLYHTVAEKLGTTSSRVERASRHAIETAFDRCDTATLYEYFGNTVSGLKGKPTNGEFISAITEWLRLGKDLTKN